MPVDRVVQHFEAAAAGYGNFRSNGLLGLLRQQERRALEAIAPIERGDRVLDVGCGDGETLAWLATRGARAVGVDVAWGMAALCRDRGFTACVQDMECLGVHELFDWVLCVGALEFASDPAAALRSLAHALRPGGRLVLLFPCRGFLSLLYAAYHRAHGIAIHRFSSRDMRFLMSDAGLQPEEQRRDGWISIVMAATKSRLA